MCLCEDFQLSKFSLALYQCNKIFTSKKLNVHLVDHVYVNIVAVTCGSACMLHFLLLLMFTLPKP